MTFAEEYLFIRFDYTTLTDNPEIKSRLLNLYCNTWKFDPNFAEFKKCPICQKYFSQHQVEILSIESCSGTYPNNHFSTPLIEAWTPKDVWQNLEPLLLKGPEFFGAVAVVPQSERIIGFVWGCVINFDDLSKKWSANLTERIKQDMPSEKVTYFQEIGVDRSFRNIGAGTVLCRMLVKWMKQEYPNLPSFLHTHEKSPAYRLFQKAGYQLYEELPGPNQGRILLACNQGQFLTPNQLINY